jgi:hypothetical protein
MPVIALRLVANVTTGGQAMTDIDVTSDDTLTLAEACALLPRGRNGSKPHLSTLVRWIQHGAPARDGRRVRLSAVRIGAKWVTSRSALREFVESLTPRLSSDASQMLPSTPRQRQRASERAARKLEEVGI